MTIIAQWNGEEFARSDNTIIVEGNHYFPPDDVDREALSPSTKTTHCPWKGDASYLSLQAGGKVNLDGAWFYPAPFEKAEHIKDYIAFWNGVTICEI
ncbi:DUF427 domain-containing protein [Altererythrobacter sp.]|nr:DUF427 domain-containing protein [Altererythrobacter sp.]